MPLYGPIRPISGIIRAPIVAANSERKKAEVNQI